MTPRCFELVVAGRALSEGPDAEIAIMMVEAGGTEDSWEYYEAGAPKVTEEVLAGGLEAAKTVDPRVDRAAARAREVGRHQADHRLRAVRATTATTSTSRCRRVGNDALSKACTITGKSERNAAIDEATESIIAELVRAVRRPRERDQGGGAGR